MAAKYPPPKTNITRAPNVPNLTARKFAQPVFTDILVLDQLFLQDQILYFRDFDMSNIGRFKIKTVKSIQTKDVHSYGQILTSALQGVIAAIESADAQALVLACRLLFLIPPYS